MLRGKWTGTGIHIINRTIAQHRNSFISKFHLKAGGISLTAVKTIDYKGKLLDRIVIWIYFTIEDFKML